MIDAIEKYGGWLLSIAHWAFIGGMSWHLFGWKVASLIVAALYAMVVAKPTINIHK